MGCINKTKAAKLKTGLVSQMRRIVITSLLFLEEACNYALCDKKISCDNAKFIVATIYPNLSTDTPHDKHRFRSVPYLSIH